jgi:hypothetical protein
MKSLVPWLLLSTFWAMRALAFGSTFSILRTRKAFPAGMWSMTIPFSILLTRSCLSDTLDPPLNSDRGIEKPCLEHGKRGRGGHELLSSAYKDGDIIFRDINSV